MLHCFRKHMSVYLYSCWTYMKVQMLEDYPVIYCCCIFGVLPVALAISLHFFSVWSCKIGKAALRHLLGSIYLFAHPRGHLICFAMYYKHLEFFNRIQSSVVDSRGTWSVLGNWVQFTASFPITFEVNSGLLLQQTRRLVYWCSLWF